MDEDTSRHVVQVLRMQIKELLQLTDGKGNVFIAEIIENNKKKCLVKILSTTFLPGLCGNITIAISLLKNTSRFEWFLEKVTEIGVSEIIPLECDRTEKHQFRYERMKAIIISAMLQSQQPWLPVLREPIPFKIFIKLSSAYQQKYIAHCIDDENKQTIGTLNGKHSNRLILIGPEGDFTSEEVEEASQKNFVPVSLGKTRLRTETAGIMACVLLNSGKQM